MNLKDTAAIEARLLELAHTTDAKITAPALAYFAPCSLEDANRVLDELTAKDQLRMDIDDDGNVVYEMPGRQKFALPIEPSTAGVHARSGLRREVGLVPAAPRPLVQYRGASPLIAAALTLFVPGAGHLYAGRVLSAILWFMVVGMGYVLILPGLVLHMFAIASATVAAMNTGAPQQRVWTRAYGAR